MLNTQSQRRIGAVRALALAAFAAVGQAAGAADTPALEREQGLVALDYQVIPVPGLKSLDLMGVHFYRQFAPGLHLGMGGFTPLVRGEYGGFMTIDVSAQVQRPIHERWFAVGGFSLGGGGGGKSVQQSKVLSGTGGYARVHAGVGHAFDDFAVGASISRMRFIGSAIGHTQPSVFLQVPFSYTVGSYASTGARYPAPSDAGAAAPDGAETVLTIGLDNYRQIHPTASNTSTIRLVNLQFSRYFAPDTFGYLDIALGYRGLPLYNQAVAGVGRRLRLAPDLHLIGQLGIGSGGYAPDTIDTGPGLLVHPKVAAEVRLSRDLGVALSAGYLAAPRGTSRNATLGAMMNYHLQSGPASDGSGVLRGYRFHMLQQTEFDVRVSGRRPDDIRMLTVQIDLLQGGHGFVPMQISVAANDYLGYPGYGEVLVGAGVQTRFEPGDRLQWFGQLLAGPNVHGVVLKPQVGVNWSLDDRLAMYAQAGRTIGIGSYGQSASKERFRANGLGLGLTYRFSMPGR